MGKGIKDLINEVKSLNKNSELAFEGNSLVLHDMADSLESNTTVFGKIAEAVKSIEDTLAGNALADREAAFEARNKKGGTDAGGASGASALAAPAAATGVLGGMLGGLGLSGGVSGLIETILGYKLIKSIFGFFKKFPSKIMTMFRATMARLIPFLATPAGWIAMGAAILGFTAWAYWEDVSTYASKKWDELSVWATKQLDNIGNTFSQTWTDLKGTWNEALTGISSWISDKTAPLFEAWDNAWAKFDEFTNVMSTGIAETQKWLEGKWAKYSSGIREYFRELFGFSKDSNPIDVGLQKALKLQADKIELAHFDGKEEANKVVTSIIQNIQAAETVTQDDVQKEIDAANKRREEKERAAAEAGSWTVIPKDPKTGEPIRPGESINISGSNNTDNSSITVNNFGTSNARPGARAGMGTGVNYND